MKTSQEIHDMIQTFDLGASPELLASQLLDILDAINRRMDDMEARQELAKLDRR
jgi:Ca2+-binding EF-hand superfamily protein